MQDIIAKYRKIMEKPVPAPFDGYIKELVEALEDKTKEAAPARKKFEVKKVLLKHDESPNPNSYEEIPVPHLNQ